MPQPSPLSDRELDIIRQVATGATNREVAHTLDISPNTVKVHLRNIYEKLGVTSRTEATLAVVREGWVMLDGTVPAEEPPSPPDEVVPSPAPAKDVAAVVTPAVEMAAPPPRLGGVPLWVPVLLGGVVLLLALLVAMLLLRPAPTDTAVESAPRRWQQLARLPEPRRAPVAVPLGRDLLLFGGEGTDGMAVEGWRYDSSAGRWSPLDPLPTPRRDAAAAFFEGRLWLIGGREGEVLSPRVLSFSPGEDRWTEMEPLPAAIAGGAAAVYEGALYLFGGQDGSGVRQEILRLDGTDGSWEEVARLPSARHGAAAVTVQDGVLLIGGRDERDTPLADVIHYDPRAAEPFRAEAPLPSPEPAPRVVALGNALYLYGASGLLERNPEREWSELAPPESALPAQVALVASDPYILLLGGDEAGEPGGTVWQYQAIYRAFVPVAPNR